MHPRNTGPLGVLLSAAEAFERGDFARVDAALLELGIPAAEFQSDELAAYDWVHSLDEELGA